MEMSNTTLEKFTAGHEFALPAAVDLAAEPTDPWSSPLVVAYPRAPAAP